MVRFSLTLSLHRMRNLGHSKWIEALSDDRIPQAAKPTGGKFPKFPVFLCVGNFGNFAWDV